jgi:hypothetical protein
MPQRCDPPAPRWRSGRWLWLGDVLAGQDRLGNSAGWVAEELGDGKLERCRTGLMGQSRAVVGWRVSRHSPWLLAKLSRADALKGEGLGDRGRPNR